MSSRRFSETAGLDEQVKLRASNFGRSVRKLRTEKSLTLRELATKSGVASSTISKVENGLMSPTYDNILRLAAGLGVDVEALFNEQATVMRAGRRSVTRRGQGVLISGENYSYEMLSTDISHKLLVPIVATLPALNLRDTNNLTRHSGEEFVYVLSGQVTILTDIYEPLRLEPGDSCYFDSTMGHILMAAGEVDAVILWVASTIEPHLIPGVDEH
jgi:transcriptional regulator with XRE-family HTH domain